MNFMNLNFVLFLLNLSMKKSRFCQEQKLIMLDASINHSCLWNQYHFLLSLNSVSKVAGAIILQNQFK